MPAAEPNTGTTVRSYPMGLVDRNSAVNGGFNLAEPTCPGQRDDASGIQGAIWASVKARDTVGASWGPTQSVSHPSHLDVEIATEKKKTSDRELHVTLSSRGAVLLRWREGTKQLGDVVSTDAAVTRLAPVVEREWNDRGLFHDANDKRVDQVMLHVEPETPYILVITVLDAISGTKRGSAPAFVVNLPLDDKMPEPTIGSRSKAPK